MKGIITCLLLFIISCKQANNNKSTSGTDSTKAVNSADSNSLIVNKVITGKEEHILDLIKNIDEVKASDNYIDSFSNHKKGIASLIFKPSAGQKDYMVQTGYDGQKRFETYYSFYVDSATYEIKVLDPVEGDKVSLEEWRKREEKKK